MFRKQPPRPSNICWAASPRFQPLPSFNVGADWKRDIFDATTSRVPTSPRRKVMSGSSSLMAGVFSSSGREDGGKAHGLTCGGPGRNGAVWRELGSQVRPAS